MTSHLDLRLESQLVCVRFCALEITIFQWGKTWWSISGWIFRAVCYVILLKAAKTWGFWNGKSERRFFLLVDAIAVIWVIFGLGTFRGGLVGNTLQPPPASRNCSASWLSKVRYWCDGSRADWEIVWPRVRYRIYLQSWLGWHESIMKTAKAASNWNKPWGLSESKSGKTINWWICCFFFIFF